LETLTNAASADIHLITLLEKLTRLQLSANLVGRGVTKTEFLQVTHRRSARLFAVTDLRLGDLILANDVVPNLDGVVTIRRFGLDLRVRELNVIPSSVVAFVGIIEAVSIHFATIHPPIDARGLRPPSETLGLVHSTPRTPARRARPPRHRNARFYDDAVLKPIIARRPRRRRTVASTSKSTRDVAHPPPGGRAKNVIVTPPCSCSHWTPSIDEL
jgi:hypothetical protein